MVNRRILMLEKDRDDRFISNEFFSQEKMNIEIDFVSNQDEFFTVLETQLRDNSALPSLILMSESSTNFPFNILLSLKQQSAFQHIPVVVLGDVTNPTTIRRYYDAGACSFIFKPVTYDQTRDAIEAFIRYWFKTVTLPE